MSKKKEEYFNTKSLNVASFIFSHDHPISDFDFDEETKSVIFYFEKNQQLLDIVADYSNNQMLKRFITSFKVIKSIVADIHKKHKGN